MSAPATLDNPNPVIFSSRKELNRENVGLWLDSAIEDDDGVDSTTSEDEDVREAIDANEVFGMQLTLPESPIY